MKERICCVLVVILLLGTLTACGLRSPAEEPVPEVSGESADLPEPPQEAVPPEPSEPVQPEVPVPAGPEEPGPEPDPPDEEPVPPPADEDLVNVLDYIPSLFVELKYGTEDNFTGTVIYDFTEARLRYGTVKKLAEVQEELLGLGYSLKIWDAFRPVSAQFKLWEICPDGNFVANPNTGYSSHSKGNTVDLTLVLSDGTEIVMPTGFDDFTALADRDYSDVPAEAAQNALVLETVMTAHGFKGYQKEWWHYSDADSYPVIEE